MERNVLLTSPQIINQTLCLNKMKSIIVITAPFDIADGLSGSIRLRQASFDHLTLTLTVFQMPLTVCT